MLVKLIDDKVQAGVNIVGRNERTCLLAFRCSCASTAASLQLVATEMLVFLVIGCSKNLQHSVI